MRKVTLLICFFICLSCTYLIAQEISFSDPAFLTSKTFHEPIATEFHDYNGDGNLDIFVFLDNDEVIWFENLGNGEIGEEQFFRKEIHGFALCDINNDQVSDIITYEPFQIELNNGAGGIDSTISLEHYFVDDSEYTHVIKHIECSDLNLDGNKDLLLNVDSYYYNGTGDPSVKYLIFQTEDFNFRELIAYASGSYDKTRLLDLDGDSFQDKIRIIGNELYFQKNDGSYIFPYEPNPQSILNAVDDISGVRISNLNEDDRKDIVLYSQIGNLEVHLDYDESTGFQESMTIFLADTIWLTQGTYTYNGYIESLKIADINSDGENEILLTRDWQDSTTIDLYSGYSQGFQFVKNISIDNEGQTKLGRIRLGTLDDFDDDGDLDILGYQSFETSVSYIENEGGNSFSESNEIYGSNALSGIRSIHSSDVTGNGYNDLIVYSNNSIYLMENSNTAPFLESDNFKKLKGANDFYGLFTFGNLNSEQGNEIIYTKIGQCKIFLLSQIEGSYDETKIDINLTNQSSRCSFQNIRIVDLNNDAFEDLLFSWNESIDGDYVARISWLESTGTDFIFHNILEETTISISFTLGDYNSDGFKDIAYEIYRDILEWKSNDGFGNFTDQASEDHIEDLNFLGSADLDNDGDDDIVLRREPFAGFSPSIIVWTESVRGNEYGFFHHNHIIGDYKSSLNVSIVDLDGDGDKDIIQGKNFFQFHTEKPFKDEYDEKKIIDVINDYPYDIEDMLVADFTGDNGPDIIFFDEDDRIVFLENTSQNIVNTELNTLPSKFNLSQNYPNPFNPSTKINYSISQTSQVRIDIFNMLGQKVATLVNKRLQSGNYSTTFDASSLTSGIYIYKLTSGELSITKKMTLIK